jgi:uncharacterized protein YqgC (DUF456 family)
MVYLWIILLILVNALCLVLVLFALPGNWLIVILTCLFAWWQEGVFSIYTLIAIAVLATLGELFEFFGGMGGARKAGAQWWGSFGALGGAICGAVLGTFLIPVLLFGTLIGACVGAGTGAWLFELAAGRRMKDSARSALGAGIGELLGITIKITLGFIIWATIAVAAFWP